MGYRSDIALVITKELKTKLLLSNELPEYLNYAEQVLSNDTSILYLFDYVKFDDSDIYPITDYPHDYYLLRVGEEYEDIETNGNLVTSVWLNRTIEFNEFK